MKKLWTAYTGFTRYERSGIAVLLSLLLLLLGVRILIQFFASTKPGEVTMGQIGSTWERRQQLHYAPPMPADTIIDINTADSAALVALDGIGAKLAHRILDRRRQLGHFKSYDELWQVYHFNGATKAEIRNKTKLVKASH
ncbi:MAG: helix-hairpin-helix domain-containing protein [Bacteroidetes bacterium]|nr:helix-hairpin-helix domain-containing protein [Bacteroidota bacterium]